MKHEFFDDFNIFQVKIENLKKENRFFFVNQRNLSIHTPEENENFLSFYLDVLVSFICAHDFDECQSFTSTNWHFYLPKSYLTSFGKSFSKDFDIMLDKLGYNFDDYDQQFTDKVGIIYE